MRFIVSATVPAAKVIAVDAADFATALGDAPRFAVSTDATLHEEDTTPLALGTGAQGSGRAGGADALAVPDRRGRHPHVALCVLGDAARLDGADHHDGDLVNVMTAGPMRPGRSQNHIGSDDDMADETKVIDVIMGPYRGHRLTMTAADADSAVNNHWATDANAPPPEPDDEPHPPLSDEERNSALEAAQTWAQAQWDAAQGVGTPKEAPPATRGEQDPEKRDLKPGEPAGPTPRAHRDR